MRIEVIHPSELGPAEWALWRAHQAANPTLASPYLTPDWAQLVGAAREDARVCVIEGGRGFLGVQRVSRFAAMGLGAPIADYQGLVAEDGLEVSGADLCHALKVGRIDLSHMPQAQDILNGGVGGSEGSWIVCVRDGAEEYRAGLKSRRAEFVRQLDKKGRKLAREHGEGQFAGLSLEQADFQALLEWKHAQLRDSGQPPIWATPWVADVLASSFAQTDQKFGGALFTLKSGDKLIAANYCLRANGVLHAWLIGHDATYDAYSPGILLARQIIEWAGEHGYDEVDFGPGDYQFKRQLATSQRTLQWGSAARPSWSAATRRAQIEVRGVMEKLPNAKLQALPGKAMRRLDVQRGLGLPLAAAAFSR